MISIPDKDSISYFLPNVLPIKAPIPPALNEELHFLLLEILKYSYIL
jgi:hypothetical protein